MSCPAGILEHSFRLSNSYLEMETAGGRARLQSWVEQVVPDGGQAESNAALILLPKPQVSTRGRSSCSVHTETMEASTGPPGGLGLGSKANK